MQIQMIKLLLFQMEWLKSMVPTRILFQMKILK